MLQYRGRQYIAAADDLQQELLDALQRGELAATIRSMRDRGVLQDVLPEIDALRGVEQPSQYHDEGDVFEHTLLVLEAAKPTMDHQLAALLHDAGKPATQEFLEDRIRFLGHEAVSGEIAEAVLTRLGFDADTIDKIAALVQNHMRPHRHQHWKKRAVRRFVRDLGDYLEDVLDLADADALGALDPEGQPAKPDTQELRRRILELGDEAPQPQLQLPLSGHDIMRVLSIPSGPAVGRAQQWLRQQPGILDMTAQQAEQLLNQYHEQN